MRTEAVNMDILCCYIKSTALNSESFAYACFIAVLQWLFGKYRLTKLQIFLNVDISSYQVNFITKEYKKITSVNTTNLLRKVFM